MKVSALFVEKSIIFPGSKINGKGSLILDRDANDKTYSIELGPEGALIVDSKLNKSALIPFSQIQSVVFAKEE